MFKKNKIWISWLKEDIKTQAATVMKTDRTVGVLFLKSVYYLYCCATQSVQQVAMLSRGWRPRRTQTVWTQTGKDVLRGGVGLLFCYFHPGSVLSREDGARQVIITQCSLVKGHTNHEWSELCGSRRRGNNEGRGRLPAQAPRGTEGKHLSGAAWPCGAMHCGTCWGAAVLPWRHAPTISPGFGSERM